jgi:sugar lactone lactonase YvrE
MVADYRCALGEGPLWHQQERRVYWVDILTGRVFWYEPATGAHAVFFQGPIVGGFTMQADGSLLLFMEKGGVATLRDGELDYVVHGIRGEENSRFNDVIADPRGRVFCGTMPSKHKSGKLYRLDCDGTLSVVLEEVGCPNGMGFSPDGLKFYFTDTGARRIYRYEYDEETGELGKGEVFVEIPASEGVPDGMVIDQAGHLWSARWGGSAVVRYDAVGVEESRISLPTPKVSSLTFGGEELTEIFITTAGGDNRASDDWAAGCLFSLSLDVAGLPEFRSKVLL